VADYAANKPWKQAKRLHIMQNAYQLFAQHGIAPVTMPEIADASQVSRATLYRYFPSKAELVIAVNTWKWGEYIAAYDASLPQATLDQFTGAEYLRFYLDAFLDLYRYAPDILCFNYDFNSYLRHETAAPERRESFLAMVDHLGTLFHALYERGSRDGTINTSVPEASMFSSSFHIMLAAATRYAVGLVYVSPGADPEAELLMLEELLFARFVRHP